MVRGRPLQLVLLAATFALAGYAGVRLLEGDTFGVVVWFVGAALLHDLVLLPVYATADRASYAWRSGRGSGLVNFVRVPAFLSGLLLLVWFPLITRQADALRAGERTVPRRLPRELAADHGRAVRGVGALAPVRTLRSRRRATKGRPSATH